ncbi:FAD/NAD(P)-binding oxidoreductase [Brevibacterium sp.]|uniref:NAD(P)/FAD-dependent oxidoreductase n=1 Tax=Brevibacterium sp. TaxID=1701 RepID=UPI002649039C|nr:FAD/NAD(P)-binding oxidoreductase [Brevibacterium sp.]MDN6159472.1 NAD(P)/FAD-dependent oxidoreductase [Brevibacterium sp.]MDN6604905.1 NAD(P)/FAD-dependent oxidoreductase [Brevibacterium sp.]
MSMHHRTVIIGGGNAGLSVAARLRNAGQHDVAVIEPRTEHYYQPLWTLVGGGTAKRRESVRPQAQVMPQGVAWIKDSVSEIDPDARTVTLHSGGTVSYDYLVVSPGLQLDWDRVPGMASAIATPNASSNYDYELAPKTWKLIKGMRQGTAVFTMPSGPIKCAGAPQKIAYLAADYWQQQGVLDAIRLVLVLPTPAMFGVEVFAEELDMVAKRYGIEVHLSSEVTDIDPTAQTVTVTDNSAHSSEQIDYTMLHVVPPQSAPDWIKHSPVTKADDPNGYVDIDPNTLQHVRWPEIFSLGDAGSSPNSKTGAAIRKQAPVVVENLLAAMKHRPLEGRYEGYASCPLTTSRNTMLLAEFDYSMQPTPSIPVIDTTHERRDMWYLKRYGLPAMYWNLILKGRA